MKIASNKILNQIILLNSIEFNKDLENFLQNTKVLNYSFKNINFHSMYILENIFENCDFENCDLYGCVLNGSIFKNCKFKNCLFRKTELQLIEFENCDFENCDFSRAQILNAKIKNTKFISCNFRGIHLCDSFIENSTLSTWIEDMVIVSNNKEENVTRLK